jgi:hypothetical protein
MAKYASHRTGQAATPAALPITVLAAQPRWLTNFDCM